MKNSIISSRFFGSIGNDTKAVSVLRRDAGSRMGIIHDFDSGVVSAIFSSLEEKELVVSSLVVSPKTAKYILSWGADYVDFEVSARLFNEDIVGHIFSADIISSNAVQDNEMFIGGVSEKVPQAGIIRNDTFVLVDTYAVAYVTIAR